MGGGGGGGWGGGQKFLLNRLQAVGTHTAGNTCSGPMVMQRMPNMQASVRILVCSFSPPPAAAPKWREWGSNCRSHVRQLAALPLGHCLDHGQRPPCCLGPHLPLTKNPNCVYLSDCLLAGSGTDGLTVNLSSRCTAEGNRIFCGTSTLKAGQGAVCDFCVHSARPSSIFNRRSCGALSSAPQSVDSGLHVPLVVSGAATSLATESVEAGVICVHSSSCARLCW